MSEDTNTTSSCASCGIAEVDDVKLRECTACDLVRYCSDECQRDHKLEHEEACKKRAAELRDELLFTLPESTHRGDCPICCLPLSLDIMKFATTPCCTKEVCNGCAFANFLRMGEGGLNVTCPFCRESNDITKEQSYKLRMKRVEANDPIAMRREGVDEYEKGNHNKAFEYWTRAAELGDVDAHHQLAVMYLRGDGVEKDEEKAMHHMEEAAIGGHPYARYHLGVCELENDIKERAVKHWIIAATQGEDKSIKALMVMFKGGCISKEDLASTLRAHQAAVDAMKSPQRDAEEKYQMLCSRLDLS